MIVTRDSHSRVIKDLRCQSGSFFSGRFYGETLHADVKTLINWQAYRFFLARRNKGWPWKLLLRLFNGDKYVTCTRIFFFFILEPRCSNYEYFLLLGLLAYKDPHHTKKKIYICPFVIYLIAFLQQKNWATESKYKVTPSAPVITCLTCWCRVEPEQIDSGLPRAIIAVDNRKAQLNPFTVSIRANTDHIDQHANIFWYFNVENKQQHWMCPLSRMHCSGTRRNHDAIVLMPESRYVYCSFEMLFLLFTLLLLLFQEQKRVGILILLYDNNGYAIALLHCSIWYCGVLTSACTVRTCSARESRTPSPFN